MGYINDTLDRLAGDNAAQQAFVKVAMMVHGHADRQGMVPVKRGLSEETREVPAEQVIKELWEDQAHSGAHLTAAL